MAVVGRTLNIISSRISAAVIIVVAAFILSPQITAQSRDYTRWVNPFIGTGGHGHTFPGATVPFGMVQLSPDTRIDNWDGSSGYHYSDDIIYGFSHVHLSGTGIPDGCDILFMPTVGASHFSAKEGDKSVNGYASKFSHANEKAEPGYYSVLLDDDGIFAEMTATKRVGFHRYTLPETDKANIILDLDWRDKRLASQITQVSDQQIEGYRESSSWSKKQRIYFVAEFSEKYDSASFFMAPSAFAMLQRPDRVVKVRSEDDMILDTASAKSPYPRNINGTKVSFTFNTSKNKQILIKVAISYVSIEGARKNLEAELPHWDFDKVRADAKAAWNKELSKIEVSGETDEQTTNFYTALYHTMIHPNVFNDVDGRYKGHDGKIHQLAWSPGFSRQNAKQRPPKGGTQSEHYTVFSLWDTFRAAHPLYTIIDEKRTVDFINTFIRIYEQGGRLPVWELWGEETDTMIGYHAVSVIADAMAKDIKGFDYEKAYEAAKHSANLDHHGLAAYKKRGYISMEDENESVSKTLEYAYNDWCIVQMARILSARPGIAKIEDNRVVHEGNTIHTARALSMDIERHSKRARYFENLFDPATGFMRPKKNGGFVTPFSPTDVTFNFTEGNSWQYSFFVPHDVSRLIELMGGQDKFIAKLDELFTTDQKLTGRFQPDITGLIGQYAHGNEPSHHIPYLYNYVGQPWKTQKYVRQIMDEFYKNSPDGLIGNEDAGQMSAWYILSASGFYPVAPGEPIYQIGTPLFKEVKFNLENGKTFTIKAPNVSEKNFYVRSVGLSTASRILINGKKPPLISISHSDILKGGVLEFEMTDTPLKEPQLFLERLLKDNFVAVPIITGERSFRGVNEITMSAISSGVRIFYTTDGSEPNTESIEYTAPFVIDESMTVRVFAIDRQGNRSHVVDAAFNKQPNDRTVAIEHRYNRQYTGGGDDGLIDGVRGTLNFASGEWQGYQPHDLIATIDLKRETTISEVGGGFLQNARSWIWMPTRIEFEVSSDGSAFTKVAEIKTDIATDDMKEQIRDYIKKINPVKARYVRVRAYNLGKIPSWHPGAGHDTFIFVDEIFIR